MSGDKQVLKLPKRLWVFAASIPLVVLGTLLCCSTFRNDISAWLSPESAAKLAFDEFSDRFGGNEYLVVSWDGCSLADPRLPLIARELEQGANASSVEHVLDGATLVEELTGQGLSRRQAINRLSGLFIGDGETTGLTIQLLDQGAKRRGTVITAIESIAEKHGIASEELMFGGPSAELQTLDHEGFWSPLRVIPLILICSFLLAWGFLRDFWLAVFVECIAIYGGALTLTIVYVSGTALNAIVWTLPTLVLLLTVSASLHFLGYYRDASKHAEPEKVIQLTWQRAWKPTVLCAATTAAGLFSLLISDTRPVRQFGLFGGLAVIAACTVVLSSLPAYLRRFRPNLNLNQSRTAQGWVRLARFNRRHCISVILLTVTGMAIATTALPELRTSANLLKTFVPSSGIVQNSLRLERNVGALASYEILLKFENADSANDLERLRRISALSRKLKDVPQIQATLSAVNFSPSLPKAKTGFRAVLQQRSFVAKLRTVKEDFTRIRLLHQTESEEIWRISARVSALAEFDAEQMRTSVISLVHSAFDDTNKRFAGERLRVTTSGQADVLSSVEKQFLQDLKNTYFTAFLVISVVVFVVLRNPLDCVIATLPNLFPALVVLGSASLLRQPLDVASLMTASVALGVAVDDTLHFMLWRAEKRENGMSESAALRDALRHCGTAMLQTSVVCGTSLAIYAFAGFMPTMRFGILLSAMLFSALLGDLLLLPALLFLRQRLTKQMLRAR